MNLKGQHLLSVKDMSRELISEIFDIAHQMRPYAQGLKRTYVLDGAILGNMFFEPSTRTRVSFGAAFNRLGGQVRETTGMSNSALAKGESLYDTAMVLSGYSDVIAMRHPEIGSVAEFAKGSRVPVINGGDGANEHPTQALLDLFTIQSELKKITKPTDSFRLTLLGDLKNGRTVHSLSQLLSLYSNLDIRLVSPAALALPEQYLNALTNAGHRITVTESIETGLKDADIVYQTRVQEERFANQAEADRYRGVYRLNQALYNQYCQSNTILMHPLPRDSRSQANELDNDLNSNPSLAIFRQTDNGVLVRMALFAGILGVEDKLAQYESKVSWFTGLKP